jgi:mono/diheme cytochrome c family protein
MKTLAGFLLAIVVLAAAGLAVVYSGAYNVAASAPHTALGTWLLDTAKRRSIEVRARSVQAPAQMSDEQAQRGFKEFDAMCVACHGAPGKEPNEAGKGLLPQPPALNEAARAWDRPQLFWIVKNGVKFTGMPAFGATHDDATIWDIVAFLERLPVVTPEEYGRLQGGRTAQPQGGAAQPHSHQQPHSHSH